MNRPGAVAQHTAIEASTSSVVLVVDDDAIFRQMTRAILEASGLTVVEAENGLQGLQMLDKSHPDLVVCDIEMPIMNGLEFVEEAAREYPSLAMIVVSSTDQMSVVANALRFGIKDFLIKPIKNPQHLLAAVDEAVKHSDDGRESTDFASEWFGLSSEGQLPDEQELHWHLKQLDSDPVLANQLLQALIPSNSSSQGDWSCRFQLMQSADTAPLVYDYVWLMNGQWLMYAIDTNTAPEHGVASALMVRGIVNDYIRRHHGRVDSFFQLVESINNSIHQINYLEPVASFFALADCPLKQIRTLNFGIPLENSPSSTVLLGQAVQSELEKACQTIELAAQTVWTFSPTSGARLRFSLSVE
jgi:CheY-like chemotaxis protein